MNNDVLFAFSIFQLTFLFLDAYVLSKTGRDIARKTEYTWFYILTLTHMLYLVLNNVWTLQEYDLLHLPRSLLMVVCTASLWTVTNCATSFFFFVEEKVRAKFFLSGPGRWIRLLPAILSTLLIVSNPWTEIVFSLSPEGYFIHESLYLPTLAMSSLYLLSVAVIGAVKMLRSRTVFQRQASGVIIVSVLVLFLFIVLDGFMKKASLLPGAVFAVIVLIFVSMQEANINSDALTGMNNRRKAVEYLTDKLSNVSAEDPLYLYIGDLDNFKGINDTYGHTEGDDALLACSRALKRTIGQY